GTLAIQSCSSDDGGGGAPNPADTMVPKSMNTGDGNEIFTYDNNRYLTKYTFVDGGDVVTYDFTYSGGRVVKVVEEYASSDNKFEYNISYPSSDKVKIIERDVTNNSTEENDITVDANGNMTIAPASFYTYDDNGNMIKATEFGDVVEYTYNSNLSMIKNVK